MMRTVWSTLSVVADLDATACFLRQQAEIHVDITAVQHAQVKSLCQKIQSLHRMDAPDAASISQKINAGPWTADQKTALANAVADRLTANRSSERSNTRCIQHCPMYHNYVTCSAADFLGDQRNAIHAKVNKMCDIAWNAGLHCPSEHTIQVMVGVLIMLGFKDAQLDANSRFNLVSNMKHQMKQVGKGRTYPYEHRQMFPNFPHELPEHVFKFAYTPEDPLPLDIDWSPLPSIVAAVPLRKTNKHLQPDQVASPAAGAPQMQQVLEMMKQCMQMCLTNGQRGAGPPEPPPQPRVTIYGDSAGASSSSQTPPHQHAGSGSSQNVGGDIASPQARPGPQQPRPLEWTPPANAAAAAVDPATWAPPAAAAVDMASPSATALHEMQPSPRGPAQPRENDVSSAVSRIEEATAKALGNRAAARATAKVKAQAKAVGGVMKRPAAAIATTGRPSKAACRRPPMNASWPAAPFGSPTNVPAPLLYNGAKVYTSHTKSGYRVLMCASDRVDKFFKWDGDHERVWCDVCTQIDCARAAEV